MSLSLYSHVVLLKIALNLLSVSRADFAGEPINEINYGDVCQLFGLTGLLITLEYYYALVGGILEGIHVQTILNTTIGNQICKTLDL